MPRLSDAEFVAATRGKARPFAACMATSEKKCGDGKRCKKLHGTWETLLDLLIRLEEDGDRMLREVDAKTFFRLADCDQVAGRDRTRMRLKLREMRDLYGVDEVDEVEAERAKREAEELKNLPVARD